MTLIRVIDFEARGPIPPHPENEIIEIGWCDVDGGLIGAPRSSLVAHVLPIDIETMAVHHLQEPEFAGAPTRGEFLRGFLTGVDVLCAHSAKFERAAWPDCAAWIPWICTYKCAIRLWPDSPRHSNQVLRYFLGLTDLDPELAMPPHRAGPDAYVTAHILTKCLERAPITDLIQWSNEPALLPRVTFGKQRGMRWSEVDDGFLKWVSVRDFDEDVLFTVKTEMERREKMRSEVDAATVDGGDDGEPF